jgi:hypothetical protein
MKTKSLLTELEELRPFFEKRNKMRVYNAFILSIINTFPEEKSDIVNMLDLTPTVGGTKVPTPKVAMNPNPNFRKRHTPKQGCESCGEKVITPKKQVSEVKRNIGIEEEDIFAAKTWRDIMSIFAGQSAPMKNFMKMQGISSGNVSKPETLAKKIFKWLQDEDKV